jgi:hypothetical protein
MLIVLRQLKIVILCNLVKYYFAGTIHLEPSTWNHPPGTIYLYYKAYIDMTLER